MSKNVSKELTFNNVAIKSLSFWISFAKVIHIFGKTKFFMLKNLNASYFVGVTGAAPASYLFPKQVSIPDWLRPGKNWSLAKLIMCATVTPRSRTYLHYLYFSHYIFKELFIISDFVCKDKSFFWNHQIFHQLFSFLICFLTFLYVFIQKENLDFNFLWEFLSRLSGKYILSLKLIVYAIILSFVLFLLYTFFISPLFASL